MKIQQLIDFILSLPAEDKAAISKAIIKQAIDAPVEYTLKYDDLISGEFYATYYEKQGLYIFRLGKSLAIFPNGRIEDSFVEDFTPKNGFHKFRKATKDEIKPLVEFELNKLKQLV